MGRRAGDVGDIGVAEASEHQAKTFSLRAEHERASSAERPQENLQTSISSNVIESRPLLQRRISNCAHQGAQRVRHKLWWSGRARGRQDPFRF